MHMYRTTILLPEDLKLASEQVAKERGMSLGALIRSQLEKVAGSRSSRAQDSVFADFVPFQGNTPSNLALNHDDELYGPIETTVRKVGSRKSK
jgi:hypothetical protein